MSRGNTTVAELFRNIENLSNKIDNLSNDIIIKFKSLNEKIDDLDYKLTKEIEKKSVKNVVNVSEVLDTNLSEIIKEKIRKFASNEDIAIPMIRELITNTVYLKALRLINFLYFCKIQYINLINFKENQ
jgi:predicted transcriptional regulator